MEIRRGLMLEGWLVTGRKSSETAMRLRASCFASLAVVAGLTWVNHWNDERDFKPLFTGLAAVFCANFLRL